MSKLSLPNEFLPPKYGERSILDSALSKMHGRGVASNHGISTLADMLIQMRRLLESKPGESLYMEVPWLGFWLDEI